MSSSKINVGAVVGRSTSRAVSMRDRVLNSDTEEIPPGEEEAILPEEETKKAPKEKAAGKPRKKRNHKMPINYFKALDDIIAESFSKQEAAHNIVAAFTQMMEARGIPGVFESDRFERAAQNMCTVVMMKQMAWVFGLGPDHADRIAEHTIDKLFAPLPSTPKGNNK